MFWGISADEILAIIGAATTIVIALVYALARVFSVLKEVLTELRDVNTPATLRGVIGIQALTIDKARLEYLERWYKMFTEDPSCETCAESIKARLDREAIHAEHSLSTQEFMKKWGVK